LFLNDTLQSLVHMTKIVQQEMELDALQIQPYVTKKFADVIFKHTVYNVLSYPLTEVNEQLYTITYLCLVVLTLLF